MESLTTRCCIAGGGPAGIMLGFLLARMGVDVVVLEKHADFLRDFRGDTIHPSTLELMHELGILDEFLKRPHQEIRQLSGRIGKDVVTIGDFTHLPTRCKFVVLMPQWDFLDFIKERASRYTTFHLRMQAEVTDLIEEGGVIAGVRANSPSGQLEVRATLTVGADGRHSTVRQRANLRVRSFGAPMDVMWMRLSRHPHDGGQTFGHIDQGKFLVLLNRETYWQCAFVIPKGAAEAKKEKGLPVFREEIAAFEPFLRDRVHELHDWKDVSVLTVLVDRLTEWSRPRLLCIGDSAHAMSPVGGVGINLAIQDAVATANLLGKILLQRAPTDDELQRVQQRRAFPTRATQSLQIFVQNRIIRRIFSATKPITLPWPMRLLQRFPYFRRFPARAVGVGFRPEHIHTPDIGVNR